MTQTASERTEQGRREPGLGTQIRRIGVMILVVYIVLFVVLNTHRVKINFVFFSVHTMTLTALALVAVLAFLAGYLAHGRRVRRR